MTFEWTEKDARAVDTARILAADAVEKVGNGHPGTPISLAPVAYLLYQKVMNTDPSDEKWIGRDRFVLSAGHASLTQYAQLYLGGLGLELGDLESLRTWGALTPGHPEYGHTRSGWRWRRGVSMGSSIRRPLWGSRCLIISCTRLPVMAASRRVCRRRRRRWPRPRTWATLS